MAGDRPLRLYNSLGRRLEDFCPERPGEVRMYSCGPTVYAYAHVGNLRAYVFADTLRRAFRWKGYAVRHVVNITDVGHAVAETEQGEDKLEVAAAREHRDVRELAAFYTDVFFRDLAALNVLPAAEYPRATAYVERMVEFARTLEERGVTYSIPSGLYLDTTKSPGYGELALIDVAGQREGARVEQVEGRRNKTDFALWRAEEPGRRRLMRWDSPWGWGAPGWHLECSVMSMALLGPHFDVHTGGVDHRELHHVNEIAQSEAYLDDGRPWVRHWLHGEFLRFGAAKMAKSEGNVARLDDLVESGVHPAAYRLFLAGGHYRSQLDFVPAATDAAQSTLRRLVARVAPLGPLPAVETLAEARAALDADDADDAAATVLDRVDDAVSDDLATPRLLGLLQEIVRSDGLAPASRRTLVAACDALLGLGLGELREDDLRQPASGPADDERGEIESLVAERRQARAARNWTRADEIRAELAERGVTLTDTPTGTTWTRSHP